MKLWQFKVKTKIWADYGTYEYENLEEGQRFYQNIDPIRNKINNCIGDTVLYYNSKVVKSRNFYEGIYLVCKIVSNVENYESIELEVIKDLRETPYMYNIDFFDLHIYHNTTRERGRIQTYELINTDKCDIKKFNESIMNYRTEGNDLLEDIKEISKKTIKKTEQDNLIKCRLGQGSFRKNLIEYWGMCSISGFKKIDILIASHIKPWKNSSDSERLDHFNGLLLIPTLDKLFDRGYISFEDNGKIIISKKLENYEVLGVNNKMTINISSRHKKYLKFHREKILQH